MLDSRAVGRASTDADRRERRLPAEGEFFRGARVVGGAEASAIAGRITSEWTA